MAYTPINWQTGDTITAEKMNKMDNGWGVQNTQLFSESVTTVAGQPAPSCTLAYVGFLTATEATVSFDSTDYTVQMIESDGAHIYGEIGAQAPDFTNYPFFVVSLPNGNNTLYTETAGTHSINVNASSLEVSANFSDAVNSCVNSPMLCVSGTTTLAEMSEASSLGRLMYFKPYGDEGTETFIITAFTNIDAAFIPTYSQITASFNNGIFTVTITD